MSYPDPSALTTLPTLKAWLKPRPQGSILSLIPLTGGSGYSVTGLAVTISDPTGSGASFTPNLTGDAVTSFTRVSPGRDYSSPSVIITGGGGSGATASAKIEDDDALTMLITGVSNTIANELPNLVIAANTSVTETRDGLGNCSMTLKKWPATSVQSIVIDGLTITPFAGFGTNGWVFDADTGSVKLVGFRFARGIQNVVISYTAGLPSGDRRLGALERATIATAALWWKRNPYAHLRSESAPQGLGTNISIQTADLPPEAWTEIRRLAPHRLLM